MRTTFRRASYLVLGTATAAVCWAGAAGTATADPATPGVSASVGVTVTPVSVHVDGEAHVGPLEAEYP